MISYKQKKNRSKRHKIKKNRIKQFCKVLLVASCGFAPFNQSFAQTNIALGTGAGATSSNADSLVSIGVNAGYLNRGAKQIFIGTNAARNLHYFPTSVLGNTTRNDLTSSIMIGYYAGYHATNAPDNVFIGEQAGYRVTTGNDNLFIGAKSGMNVTTGTDNTFIGVRAGINTMTGTNRTGEDNVFIGEEAGFYNTTGSRNVFVGEDAGYNNTTANENVFIGRNSGYRNTTAYQNAFFGTASGYYSNTNQGHHNTALGDSTLHANNEGKYNTVAGAAAGPDIKKASYNTFIGAYSGYENNIANNYNRAQRNTYLGAFAGTINRMGSDNTGVGCRADFVPVTFFTDINNTVFLGASSSVAANGAIVIGKSTSGSGTNGIAIGTESSTTASNVIAIGYQASATTANEIAIGNAAHTTIGGAVNWTATSDGRFKTNVKENVVGLKFINQLRPVTYHFDSKKLHEHNGNTVSNDLDTALLSKNQIRYTGFIAQEVEAAAEEVGFEFSGVDKKTQVSDTLKVSDTYGLRYAEFVVPLVKATQELSQKVEQLEKENTNLSEKIAAQKELRARYEAALESALLELETLEQSNKATDNQ